VRVPRHLKHPIALWIIDGRESLTPPLTTRDIARRLNVDEATVRRWESARAGETRNLPAPSRVEQLEKILGRPSPERAAPSLETAIVERLDHQTRLLEQLVSQGSVPLAEPATKVDAKTLRKRRRFWLDQAARRLALTNQRQRLKLLGWPTTLRDRLGRLERSEDDLRPDEIRDFARAYRIPERILTDPPPTDEERLEEWQEIALVELAPVEPTAASRRQRRAS
jgi:transcriptional regulator with XRE-family HTH domain